MTATRREGWAVERSTSMHEPTEQHAQRALLAIQDMANAAAEMNLELRRLRAERDLIYADIAALGMALGHPDTARPESPQIVFRRWVEEVHELKARMDGLCK